LYSPRLGTEVLDCKPNKIENMKLASKKENIVLYAYHRISLEDDNPATFITSSQQISIMVEFDTRDDVSCRNRRQIKRQM